jgi:hypothetical protein
MWIHHLRGGYHKQGAGYGYTHQLGYHPLLTTSADTGEVLHARHARAQPTPPGAPGCSPGGRLPGSGGRAGRGGLRDPSDDGGLEEVDESWASRRSSSATWACSLWLAARSSSTTSSMASSSAIRSAWAVTSATSSS